MKKIAKPWAAFGGLWKDSMGKVIRVLKDGDYDIQYLEEQMYPTELWEKSCVKTFRTPEELVNYIVEYTGEYRTSKDAMEALKDKFPSSFKKK